MNLEEAKQKTFLIRVIDGSEGSTNGFKVVSGTLLDNDLFAAKDETGKAWKISDLSTGLALKFKSRKNSFNTLTEIKEFVNSLTDEQKEIIKKARSTDQYKKDAEKLDANKHLLEESLTDFNIDNVFEELNKLY